jgi:hypothetical protein
VRQGLGNFVLKAALFIGLEVSGNEIPPPEDKAAVAVHFSGNQPGHHKTSAERESERGRSSHRHRIGRCIPPGYRSDPRLANKKISMVHPPGNELAQFL